MQRRVFLLILLGSLGAIIIGKQRDSKQVSSEEQDSEKSEKELNSRTDFEKAFQESYSFKYEMPEEGLQTVEFSVNFIGELILTSGQLIACDPLLQPDTRRVFSRTLPQGKYPILLSLAGFKPRKERRIACAMLQVTQQKPVKWELATVDNRAKEYQGYGVDSGTGGFMDLDAAYALEKLSEPDPVSCSAALEENNDKAWKLVMAGLKKFEQEYCDRVIAEMKKNQKAAANNLYPYDRKGDWANITINDKTDANVIAFSSGWGDGGYASYWGYDSADNIACIVTDFGLFAYTEAISKILS